MGDERDVVFGSQMRQGPSVGLFAPRSVIEKDYVAAEDFRRPFARGFESSTDKADAGRRQVFIPNSLGGVVGVNAGGQFHSCKNKMAGMTGLAGRASPGS